MIFSASQNGLALFGKQIGEIETQIGNSINKIKQNLNGINARNFFPTIKNTFSDIFGKKQQIPPINILPENEFNTVVERFERVCSNSDRNLNRFVRSAQNAHNGLDLVTDSLREGTATYDEYMARCQETNNALNTSRATLIATRVAAKALNMAFNTLMAFGISTVISTVISGIDNIIHKGDKLIEKAKNISENYNESIGTISSNKNTLEDLKNEFVQLSKGVDKNGKNISLSAEEFDRYKSIVKQIVDISPDLVKGYDNEGNALLNYSSLLEDAIDAQKRFNEEKQKEYLLKDDSIFNGLKEKRKKVDKNIAKVIGTLQPYNGNILNDIFNKHDIDLSKVLYDKDYNELEKVVKNSEQIINDLIKQFHGNDKQKNIFKDAFGQLELDIKQIDSTYKEWQDFLSLWASQNVEGWGKIDDGLKDNFYDGLEGIAKDEEKSASEMEIATNQLAKDFLKVQDSIPTKEIEGLKKSYSDGKISADSFNQKLQEQIDKINQLAIRIKETNPLLATILQSIADEESDFKSENTASASTNIDTTTYEKEIDELQEKIKQLKELSIKVDSGEFIASADSSEMLDYIQELNKDYPELAQNILEVGDNYQQLHAIINSAILETTTKKISKLQKELNQLNKKKEKTPEDLSNLEFLKAQIKFLEQVRDNSIGDYDGAAKGLANLEKQYLSYYELLQKINKSKKGITPEIQSSIIQSYPELIRYMDDEVALREKIKEKMLELDKTSQDTYQDLIDADQLLYKQVISNENGKIQAAFSTFNQTISKFNWLKDELANGYQMDVNNFKNAATAKSAIDTLLIRNCAAAWSDYYSVTLDAQSGLYKVGTNENLKVATSTSELQLRAETQSDALQNANDAANAANKVLKAFKDGYSKFKNYKIDLGKVGSGSSKKGSKGTTTNEFKQTLDWAAETIKKFTSEISKLQAKLNDTRSYKNQITYTKQLIDTQAQLKYAYQQTQKVYSKEYNKALKKLSKSDRNKVMNGSYTMETFLDKPRKVKSGSKQKKGKAEKRYNNIQEAIKLRDNLRDAETSVFSASAQLKEFADNLAEIHWKEATEKCENISNSIDVLNAKLSVTNGYIVEGNAKTKDQNDYLDEILKKEKAIVSEKKKAVNLTQKDISAYKKQLSAYLSSQSKSVLGKVSKKNKEKKDYKTDDTLKIPKIISKSQKSAIETYNKLISQKNKLNSNKNIDITGLTKTNLANAVKYNALLQQQLANKNELTKAEAEYKQKLAETAKQQFDNIDKYYQNRISKIDAREKLIKNKIDLAEAKNLAVGASFYKEQIKREEEKQKRLKSQAKDLQKQLDHSVKAGEVKKYSDSWYEMVNAIYNVKDAIDQSSLSVIEFQKSLSNLKWDNLDKLVNKFNTIVSEANFLIDIMSNKELVDDKGNFTDEGITTQGLHMQNYDAYQYEAQLYANAIKELDKQNGELAMTDEGYEDYIEQRNRLVEAQQNCIQQAESEKKAIIDLKSNAVDAITAAYKEQTDAAIKALEAEQDLYEYEKSITKKRENLALIQKKLAALANDDSLETRKRKKELEKQLKEAQEEIDDTERQHSIQSQKDYLNDNVEKFTKTQEEYKKNTEQMFQDSITDINASSERIGHTLSHLSQTVGYKITKNISSAWKDSGVAVTSFSTTFKNVGANMLEILDSIKLQWDKVASSAEKAAINQLNALKNQDTSISSATKTKPIDKSAINKVLVKRSANEGVMIDDSRSDLMKYILNKGYRDLSNANIVKLAKALNVSGVQTEKDLTKSNKTKILNALKKAGFKNGGTVKDIEFHSSEFNRVIKSNGDDGIATVKRGECIITNRDTPLIKKSIEALSNPQLAYVFDKMPFHSAPSYEKVVEPSIEINNHSPAIVVQGNADKQTLNEMNKMLNKKFDEIVRTSYHRGARFNRT